ncbi:MAG: TauD/TfdA family dioxygenase, partial [Chloroflexi bacterium]|nr:TauD/TfdA family dioxygenase [Chloroflexota bacterium]
YGIARTAAAFWGMGLRIGDPVSQNYKGHLLGHVLDLMGDSRDKDPTTRAYNTSSELDYHTDSCDVVVLLCLQKAKSGGLSSVASAVAVYNEMLRRRPDLAEEASRGEIIAVAGIPEVTIGETLANPIDPRPLPVIKVDEPSLSMTIGINTSPLAGLDGSQMTARLLKARLDKEVIGNVAIRVKSIDRPDVWEVQGRGELQLAVLVETMRREGFELTVGKPQVVTKEIDGKIHEPVERLSLDIPEEFMGAASQMLAVRKGRMVHMVNHGTGWVRLDYIVPARALIGFHTEFLTETRGRGILHHVFEGYEPWHGDLRTRQTSSLVADRRGQTKTYALLSLSNRGTLFIGPGVEVYEGMIIGENPRQEDMDVNPSKEKKASNVRSSTAEATEVLTPASQLSLEQALEFLREDECLEVTPENVRLRKVILSRDGRSKARKKATAGAR